jgi:hypothetical protein
MDKEDVSIMARVKSYLDAIPLNYQNQDYKEICNRVNSYIKYRCQHEVQCDSVDIDYERSKTVYYCEICLKTFHLDEIYKEMSKEVNYSRNIYDVFLFYKERLYKIEEVRRIRERLELDCSYDEENQQFYVTHSFGLSKLAGYRFEGNVFWLNKETANVAKN